MLGWNDNDGIVAMKDGTKYVSSVRFASVSHIKLSEDAGIVAKGILSARSMCFDSIQNQLLIHNGNFAFLFIKHLSKTGKF